MLSASTLRNMIPPADGWPSARRQCRTAATVAKQRGLTFTHHIGRRWFTVEVGQPGEGQSFRQPYTAGGAYCRYVATALLAMAFAEPNLQTRRELLEKAVR